MSDYTPVFIAILFVVIAFIIASRKGVVSLLASGTAIGAGMAVMLSVFEYLPHSAKTYLDIDLNWKFSLGVAAGLALIVFLVCRVVFSILFKRLFNRDGMLHRLVDGVPGGIISLVPSLIGVFIYFTCLRAAGTVQELNYIDSLSRDEVREMAGKIPPYPAAARWRNAIETLPFVAEILDLTDPFSRRTARNAAAFVLAWDGIELRSHLIVKPETGSLADSPRWSVISDDPAVSAALKKFDRVGVVTAPALQAAAEDPETREALGKVTFKTVLESFVTSLGPLEPTPAPERSEIIVP